MLKKLEMKEMSPRGLKKLWLKRSSKEDCCGLGMWSGWKMGRLPIAALRGQVEGKSSRGRQRKIWMNNVILEVACHQRCYITCRIYNYNYNYNVREDLKEKNIDLARISEATRNREVWRSLVRASSSAR